MREENKEKLNKYLLMIKDYTQLTKQQNILLLNDSNSKNINKLFIGNCHLVTDFIINNYSKINLDLFDMDDLIQEGNITLVFAIKQFDIKKGYSLQNIFFIMLYQKYKKYLLDLSNNKLIDANVEDIIDDTDIIDQLITNLDNKLLYDKIKKYVEKLPFRYSYLVEERFNKDKSRAQIAREINIKESTIKSTEAKVLQKIRKFCQENKLYRD